MSCDFPSADKNEHCIEYETQLPTAARKEFESQSRSPMILPPTISKSLFVVEREFHVKEK